MKSSKVKKSGVCHDNGKNMEGNASRIEIDSSWKPTKINVVMHEESKLNQTPRVIRSVDVYQLPNQSICATHLVQQLRKLKVVHDECSLSYYLKNRNAYIFGAVIPKEGILLPITEEIQERFISNDTLCIKIRHKQRISTSTLMEQQKQRFEEPEEEIRGGKPLKQKRVGEVIEKVALWRKFYTGFYDESGNFIHKQLEIAAQDVGIAKKTLDDYLLQIRNGKKYGFNFNEKYQAKIGELRAFVRDEKKKQEK